MKWHEMKCSFSSAINSISSLYEQSSLGVSHCYAIRTNSQIVDLTLDLSNDVIGKRTL